MRVYAPLLKDTTNANPPIYIVFRGTDLTNIYDIYRDLSVLVDYSTTQALSVIDTELDNIITTLSPFLVEQQRKVHIIGHSLGALYALRLLYKLHIQEIPNFDHLEINFKATLYAPLLLNDYAVQYFRSETMNAYAKNHITIHTITGDFLNPFITRDNGVGTVYQYNSVDLQNVNQIIDATDYTLGSWASVIIGSTQRASYLTNPNHKILSFEGEETGLSAIGYELIQPFTFPFTATIQTLVQKNVMITTLTNGISTTSQYLKHLYIYENPDNLNSQILYLDYPGVSHTTANYNWNINKYSDNFMISTDGTTKYINFQISMTAQSDVNKPLHHYLVRVENNNFTLRLTENEPYRITNGDVALPYQLEKTTELNYVNAEAPEHINRFKFTLGSPVADAEFHINQRRTFSSYTEYLTTVNPYLITELRYHMWEQNPPQSGIGEPISRGDIGYVYIRYGNNYIIAFDNNTHGDVYGASGAGAYSEYISGFSSSSYTVADNHIWKIEWVSNNSYRFTNTKYDYSLFGKYSQELYTSESPALTNITYTNPLINGTYDTSTAKWTLKLVENSENIVFSQVNSFNVDNYYGYLSVENTDPSISPVSEISEGEITFF